jgi:hypothetical protein
MKVLLFGDGPALKEKGKALREQNGWTVQLRTIQRWAGEVEPTDAVYFLTPAEAIRSAYKARGIECFLVEETKDAPEDGAPWEGESSEANAATDPQTEAGLSETGAGSDREAAKTGETADAPGETPSEKIAKTKDSRSVAKKAK